jgi:TonB family protein
MPAICRSSFSLLLFLLASASLAQTPPPVRPPYRVGGNVTRPEKISGAPPAYTVEARKARVTGVVILEAVIDEQGNVTDVKVLKGLPAGLDQSALEAVQSWKFNPATLDGRPVPVYYTLTVNFTMESEPTFGPLLLKFMRDDLDFGGLVTHRRFDEALALLEAVTRVPRSASPGPMSSRRWAGSTKRGRRPRRTTARSRMRSFNRSPSPP